MLFNSIHFLAFFPVVVLIYFLIPKKISWIWLLVCSYYFYMSWNPIYAVLILTSTIITYLSGVFIFKYTKHKKLFVGLSFLSNLSILFFYKYFNFLNDSLVSITQSLNIEIEGAHFDILLPVGISFYTFQALSYTMDVYRGHLKPEYNFGKYALFVSFFPQLVAGPIERSTHLLPQFSNKAKFDYDRIKSGLLLMLWGFFQKLVIADRLAILVNKVYNNPGNYEGFQLVLATVFFSFQIFCDFAAYSDIAIGASKVLGFDLMQNFNRPYFSKNMKEFWGRWHISLSSWFRDYLYIPLGGSRGSKSKTYFNLMIVFMTSGLWHGANWTFVAWGFVHGFLQIIEGLLKPIKEKLIVNYSINKSNFSYKFFSLVITFSLVSFAWIFFRANNIYDAIYIIKNMFVFNPETILVDDLLYSLGLNEKEFRIAIYSIIFLIVIHYLQRNSSIREWISIQWLPLRWLIYFAVSAIILIYGIYGSGYDASQFLYFQF